MFTGLFLYRKEAGVWECNFSVLNKPSLHSALVNVITEKGIIKPKNREIVCCKVQNLVLWQSRFFDDFKYAKTIECNYLFSTTSSPYPHQHVIIAAKAVIR